MVIQRQTTAGNHKLLLVFSGWGVSPAEFRQMEIERDTDLWICHDYREMRFDESRLSNYREIRLVAWSLGVWVASTLFGRYPIDFAGAVAINGTPCPVHDQWGIPETIFRGTLENLSPEGAHRFNRRMCGSQDLLQAYEQTQHRPLADIREELKQLYEGIKGMPSDAPLFEAWTGAVISSADRIFPTANQRAYWQDRCPVSEIDAPHYPFHLWKQWNEIWKQ